jgi:hypothetical protein
MNALLVLRKASCTQTVVERFFYDATLLSRMAPVCAHCSSYCSSAVQLIQQLALQRANCTVTAHQRQLTGILQCALQHICHCQRRYNLSNLNGFLYFMLTCLHCISYACSVADRLRDAIIKTSDDVWSAVDTRLAQVSLRSKLSLSTPT